MMNYVLQIIGFKGGGEIYLYLSFFLNIKYLIVFNFS
jgi:hypothetical protein